MKSSESRLTAQLIMIEVLGTGLFLLLLGACVIICRKFVKKSLKECTVLITNGDSALSHELSTQLARVHNCHVVLISNKKSSALNRADDNGRANSLVSTYQCNVLDNAELAKLAQTMDDNFGGVDLVIQNNSLTKSISSNDCANFIDYTSNGIRETINLLMHFIPKMKYSSRGHFVSIQSNGRGVKPYLETNSEINALLRDLTVDFPISDLPDNKPKISSVIFKKQKCDNSQLSNGDDLMLNQREIAEAIINGIEYQQSVIRVSDRRSLIGYIWKMFKTK